MRRRARTRRVLKWVGTAACVLACVAFLVSVHHEVAWLYPPSGVQVGVASGVLYIMHVHGSAAAEWRRMPAGWGVARSPQILGLDWLPDCWTVRNFSSTYTCPLWIPFALFAAPTVFLWWRDRRPHVPGLTEPHQWHIRILKWLGLAVCMAVPVLVSIRGTSYPNLSGEAVFLLNAVVTATLWWHDERHLLPGHCQHCGYNLTGNVSGRCPECGTAVGDDKAADANG